MGIVINTSQIQDILTSNYTLTNNTYSIIDNKGIKIVPAIYAQTVTQIIGESGYGVFLTTKKGYIRSFSVNFYDNNITEVTDVNIEYDSLPSDIEKGTKKTDTSTIYLDLEDTLKLYFVLYNDVNVYRGNDPSMPNYLQFIEKVPVDFPVAYESKKISSFSPTSNPYLYLGELYNDIDNDSLYGGTDITALRKLSWIPSSKVAPLTAGNSTLPLTNMEGDTYYQRWDCLKTFPTTEEDVNQIVDITSFMVETHRNLDGRNDINRASYSLMSRPINFNLFNGVYNQKNNIFEYTTRWNELSTENIPNQIIWSMTKLSWRC